MLQMLEGPLLGGKRASCGRAGRKPPSGITRRRRLVTAATTTIPPSHRQHQHRLHHLSDILGFYPGCGKQAHLKGPPRSTATEATSWGSRKEDSGLRHLHSRQAASSLSHPPPPRPRGSYGRFSGALEHFCGQRNGQSLHAADRSQLQHSGAGATPGDTAGPPAPGRGCLTTSGLQCRVPVRAQQRPHAFVFAGRPLSHLDTRPRATRWPDSFSSRNHCVLQTKKDSGTILDPEAGTVLLSRNLRLNSRGHVSDKRETLAEFCILILASIGRKNGKEVPPYMGRTMVPG